MRKAYEILALSFLFFALVACDENKDTTATDTTQNTVEKSERVNPLADQMDALQKAKNLEAEMQKSVEDRLKAIDSQQ